MSAQKRKVSMITIRVYDHYNSIALQAVETDDLEGCEFFQRSLEPKVVEIWKN